MTGSPHAAVLAQEATEALNIRPDGIYVDCTFGRGGHSRLILEQLGKGGRLIALDRDPEAVTAGRAVHDPRFAIVHSAFSGVSMVLQGKGVYRLNKDWVEVEAGDFMWLRAFCPQACYAGGPEPFRYLLYKDMHRHFD